MSRRTNFSEADTWSTHADNKIGISKFALSNMSKVVRGDQFQFFCKLFSPTKKTSILDVGTTPSEELPDSNFFEQVYPFPKQVVIASVEDCRHLVKKYSLHGFKKVAPGAKLPFKTKQFDIVTSWATLEHVGGYEDQYKFLHELARVGKNIFVTTPYKYCIFEPHTQMLFLHWLPNNWYRAFLRFRKMTFWAKEANWNALGLNDVKRMLPPHCRVKLYKMWGFLPSHLIIYSARKGQRD